ncbi:unnamed protein product [Lepeophtheirus salmonis]|uniref:(salmon louse) hypothetical protein n=1 Tax=Lepeophtheirus salmonis TaxID=72036 RepID=A0A7R8CJD9_LEPSM|nr:unnamed protein product [Lepeophtheirus salmonis]CAF2835807.1 unnamed protein product [Lepeophtheirus salmonis]
MALQGATEEDFSLLKTFRVNILKSVFPSIIIVHLKDPGLFSFGSFVSHKYLFFKRWKACRRLNVKPVDLLPDKIDEARIEILKDGGELTYETLAILRDAESERREILETCRQLRHQLIQRDSRISKKKQLNGIIASHPEVRFSLRSVFFDNKGDVNNLIIDDRPEADQSMYSSYHSTTEILIDDEEEEFRRSRSRSGISRFSSSPPSPPTIQYPSHKKHNKLPPALPKTTNDFTSRSRTSRKTLSNSLATTPTEKGSPRFRRMERSFDKKTQGSFSQPRSSSLNSKTKDLLKGIDDIPDHDRRILERLALKKRNKEMLNRVADEKHKEWQKERSHSLEAKRSQEMMWSSFVEKKRRSECEQNEIRMMEARKKMEESQNRLRLLIHEKEQRIQLALQDSKRARSDQYLEWHTGEEQRRKAVESALQELLVRDTRYRRDLASHLESRLQSVDARRELLKTKEAKLISESNSEELDEYKKRRKSLESARKEQIDSLRQAIHSKDMKIANFNETNEFRKKKIDTAKVKRGVRLEQTQALKRELEASMNCWRKKVLEVQTESIKKAEENVHNTLEEKRHKLDLENQRRFERQKARFAQVQDGQRRKAEEVMNSIEKKQKRMANYHKQREKELHFAKERARQTSELRQALISSNAEDEYVDALISRVVCCQISETL